MKFSTFKAFLLAATLLAPVAANAADSTTTYQKTTTESSAYGAYTYLSNVYVGAQVGYNDPVSDGGTFDETASFTGLAGYKFNDMFRTDLEVSYRNNDYSETLGGFTASGDGDAWAFLANGWVDFKNDTYFTPYIGGGIGFTHASLDADVAGVNIVDDNDTAFTYQLGAGLAYEITPNVSLTADYRYIDTSDFDFTVSAFGVTATESDDYRAHEVRAGIRYSF